MSELPETSQVKSAYGEPVLAGSETVDGLEKRHRLRELTKRIVDSLYLRSRDKVLKKSQRVGINFFLRSDRLWGIEQHEQIVQALKQALPMLHLHDDSLTDELIKEFDLYYTQVRVAQASHRTPQSTR